MNKLMQTIRLIAIKSRVLAIVPVFGLVALLPGNVLAKQSENIFFEGLAFVRNTVNYTQISEKTGNISPNSIIADKNCVNTDLSELNNYLTSNKAPVSIAVAGSIPEDEKPNKIVKAVITAYTSTPDQTDDTPFIGASGKHVYDGMIAANWLPFGTKVKIPALYGDKVFTVDDRMNSRYGYGRMDIWLDTSKSEALKFGVKRVEVQIFYEKPATKKLVIAK
jgi:3D (Asp-Asp-Asp) domain-containing protein